MKLTNKSKTTTTTKEDIFRLAVDLCGLSLKVKSLQKVADESFNGFIGLMVQPIK